MITPTQKINETLRESFLLCLRSAAEFSTHAGRLIEQLERALPEQALFNVRRSPEIMLSLWRAQGVTDPYKLAAKLDEAFPGELSDAKLGALLPAQNGVVISWAGRRSRGQRLRGKRK